VDGVVAAAVAKTGKPAILFSVCFRTKRSLRTGSVPF
jgi:hypothetical protein